MSPRGAALLLLTLPALSGCNEQAPSKAERAPVRVVPGTISDAMLQTDQLQAQAPFAEPIPSGVPGETGAPTRRGRQPAASAPREPGAETAAEPAPGEPAAATTAGPPPTPSPKAAQTPAASPTPTRAPGPPG